MKTRCWWSLADPTLLLVCDSTSTAYRSRSRSVEQPRRKGGAASEIHHRVTDTAGALGATACDGSVHESGESSRDVAEGAAEDLDGVHLGGSWRCARAHHGRVITTRRL